MEPIKLELTLDLDKHLHSTYRQTGEDDYEPVAATLEALLLDMAAQKIVGMATSGNFDLASEIRTRLASIRAEQIRDQVKPLVEAALTAPIRKTNDFGDPRGPETTLRDLILDEAQAAVKRMVEAKGDSFRTSSRSPLQELIHKEVDQAFTKEVKAVLDAAKADVIAAVRAKGSELLADTVRDMAGRL